jgi:methionyl-tRNA formyltransferase
MRIVFAGTPEPAVPSLRALLASRHEVAGVLTRPDARSGRGRGLRQSPVAEIAEAEGVRTLKPVSPNTPDFADELAQLAPDCVAVVAYGALIKPELLAIPPRGWVNLHFSLLPAWRGAAPVQHALLHGDDVTGATTFRLEQGLDTGPVYGVVTEPVRPRDTSGDLLARLATSGAGLLLATIDGIDEERLAPRPQPEDDVSLAPKITVEMARIDWSAPALQVDRLARATDPAPGAWTTFRGERLKVGPVELSESTGLKPGELRVTKSEVLAGTVTSAVRLGTVQAVGKRAMSAGDWARGLRPQPGESFQ